jgi:hypothetical protein
MVYVYRLKLAVDDNVAIELDASSLDELCSEFVKLGGQEDWLRNTAAAVVVASLHGEAPRNIVRSLGGTIFSETESDPFAVDAGKSTETSSKTDSAPITPNAAPATSTAMSDPFANAESPMPSITSAVGLPADPWADEDPNAADKEWPGEAAVARTALMTNKPPPVDPWGSPEPSAPVRPQTPTETTTTTSAGRGLPGTVTPLSACARPRSRRR